MAGSYRHITRADGSFRGIELIENLGDALEALEECYYMIHYLTDGNQQRIFEAYREGYARPNIPRENMPLITFESFWERGEEDEEEADNARRND